MKNNQLLQIAYSTPYLYQVKTNLAYMNTEWQGQYNQQSLIIKLSLIKHILLAQSKTILLFFGNVLFLNTVAETDWLWVRALPASMRCVLEQDRLQATNFNH